MTAGDGNGASGPEREASGPVLAAEPPAQPPPVKVIEIYPTAAEEPPPPSFLQALIGYGSILLGLVALAALLGVLLRLLR